MYTLPHVYNPETGKCWQCDAVSNGCDHHDATPNEAEDAVMLLNPTYDDLCDGTHAYWFDVYREHTCNECGQTFMRYIERAWEPQAHTFEDDHCSLCYAIGCEHENKELIKADIYYLLPGQEWYSEGWGYHYGDAVRANIYYCYDCYNEIYEPLSDGPQWISKEDCYSNDGDIWCDACGWAICDHSDLGKLEAKDEYPQWDGDAYWIGNGHHVVMARYGREYYCPDCEEYLAKPTHEGLKYFENIPHSWDDEGKCSECGALKADCIHPQGKQTLLYWQGGEVASYDDRGDSYHTVVYVTATEHYECGVCGEKYQVLVEMKEDVDTHKYVDDK